MNRHRLALRPRTIVLLAILLSAVLLGPAVLAAAQETPDVFSIKAEAGDDPATTEAGYFVFDLAARGEASGAVRLTNPTDAAITVDLLAVDAITANSGGSAFATADATPVAAGVWVQIEEAEVVMEPETDTVIEFTVEVPDDTAPGQYLAGFSAAVRPEASDETPDAAVANEAGASIDPRTRYVIGVQIDVDGEWTPSLQVDDVALIEQPSGSFIGISLRNDGDTFLRPTGTLTLTDDQGAVVVTQSIEMGTFITGTGVTFPVAWPGGAATGDYRSHVELAYGDGQTATFDGTLTVAAAAASTITVSALDVTGVHDNATGDLQYVDVAIAIDNPAAAVPNARLTLMVSRDGEPVEAVVLSSGMTVQAGPGAVNQRYFPPGGWTPGSYTFAVSIETVDPVSGEAILIVAAEGATPIVVD